MNIVVFAMLGLLTERTSEVVELEPDGNGTSIYFYAGAITVSNIRLDGLNSVKSIQLSC